MVAGDSVLGFKGKKEKIFADNAVGEMFEARNHSAKYTYTRWNENKQVLLGPEAWRINFSWEYSLKPNHPTVFTDIVRGVDKVLQNEMNTDALHELWTDVHAVDSHVRPRMLIVYWTVNDGLDNNHKATPLNERDDCFKAIPVWAKNV
jgi:hypothetical protein